MNEQKDKLIKDNHERHLLDNASILKIEPSFLFLKKKIERLSQAIFLITNFFSDNEPLKKELRESALIIIKDMSQAIRTSYSEKEESLRTVAFDLSHLATLIELASTSGFISTMNASVLLKELQIMMNSLDTKDKKHSLTRESHHAIFDHNFFAVQDFNSSTHNATDIPGSHQFSQQGHQAHSISTEQKSSLLQTHVEIKNLRKDIKGHLKDNIIQDPTHVPLQQNQSIKRQTIIIQALKKDSFLSIKDFSRLIKDCSEKTIQRELIDLVKKGQLKKTGERRWSMYSLV